MWTYGTVDVWLRGFLASALDGGRWSASQLCRFAPGAHWMGGVWVGPGASLGAVVGRECPLSYWGLNPFRQTLWPSHGVCVRSLFQGLNPGPPTPCPSHDADCVRSLFLGFNPDPPTPCPSHGTDCVRYLFLELNPGPPTPCPSHGTDCVRSLFLGLNPGPPTACLSHGTVLGLWSWDWTPVLQHRVLVTVLTELGLCFWGWIPVLRHRGLVTILTELSRFLRSRKSLKNLQTAAWNKTPRT
jgi:hypothetical protein